MSAAVRGKTGEDRWVRTMCGLCYGQCSIRVHVVDGLAVMIEGDPASTYGARGGTCGKAISALQILYDPNRINYPVRRGNPEKGLGVDPRWQRITWEEICDRILRARFGESRGLTWFAEHGFAQLPKRVEEAYWRPFVDARSSIYMEFLADHGREIGELCEPRDIKVDLEQYTPLLSWFPPVIQREKDPALDLYAFSYKDVVHAGSGTHGLPWLAEISDRNPWHNFIMINRKTAETKGLKDLDWVYLENARGRKVKGRIHTVEGVHPQCVALIVGAGKFARGMPLARHKGSNMNVLLEGDLDHCCPISLNIETAAKVKIYRASAADPPMVYQASKPRNQTGE